MGVLVGYFLFFGGIFFLISGFCKACHFGCFKGVSVSGQVFLNGIQPVTVGLIILKERALF